MNRTDRLLAIVLELQRHGRRRAEDLATTFGTSKRTIYRDIEALSEAGVPIAAMTGHGYELMEGYFLPPLMFTTDEAAMLLLGVDVMEQNFDALYRMAAQAAAAKIEAALPERLRADVQYLKSSLHFVESTRAKNPGVPSLLQQLRRAVIERRRVRFLYHVRWSAASVGDKNAGSEGELREADPYGLAHVAGVWYLVAYDQARQDRRHFRLDRMEQLTLLKQTFSRPTDFRFELEEGRERRPVTVKALFASSIARWVREEPSFFTVRQEETSEGLLVTLRVRQEEDILQWLLSWGRQVRVLEPLSLCNRLAAEARAILQHYA